MRFGGFAVDWDAFDRRLESELGADAARARDRIWLIEDLDLIHGSVDPVDDELHEFVVDTYPDGEPRIGFIGRLTPAGMTVTFVYYDFRERGSLVP